MLARMHLSAAACRIVPYAAYLSFLALEELVAALGLAQTHGLDMRWIYPAKAIAVALALAWLWSRYEELRPAPRLAHALLALGAGVVVWWLWISLDMSWATLGSGRGYDPRGADGAINPVLAGFRIFGAMLVVPVMEELFWRSFVMRWIVRPDFMAIAPAAVRLFPFVVTAVLFGFQHHLWLAGIVAGVVYGALYVRTGNLWVPVLAHAVTNGALGAWVLATGQWSFW